MIRGDFNAFRAKIILKVSMLTLIVVQLAVKNCSQHSTLLTTEAAENMLGQINELSF